MDSQERIAASWAFTDLMEHWKRKHALAAYVPFVSEKAPSRRYQYGSHVRLAF